MQNRSSLNCRWNDWPMVLAGLEFPFQAAYNLLQGI